MRQQIKAATSYTAEKTRRAAIHSYRMTVELFVLLVAGFLLFWTGVGITNAQMVLFKLLQLSLIVMYIHIGREFLFDYIGLKRCIFGTDEWESVPPPVRAAVIIGVFLFYAAGIVGFMTGL